MFEPLAIPDLILVRPKRFGDERGWFCETFSLRVAASRGWPNFVQDNESLSTQANVVRGLHFQRAPFAQAKLVRCVQGALFDVAVDIRPNSPTYGRHVVTQLSAENGAQLFIPAGFAHGFCTLAPNTLAHYKVSAPYAADFEGGIAWDDPVLGIAWPVGLSDAILSDRDRCHPTLSQAEI
jgi:dTDP-4-dehydrorhamnose 3,5-epimerase